MVRAIQSNFIEDEHDSSNDQIRPRRKSTSSTNSNASTHSKSVLEEVKPVVEQSSRKSVRRKSEGVLAATKRQQQMKIECTEKEDSDCHQQTGQKNGKETPSKCQTTKNDDPTTEEIDLEYHKLQTYQAAAKKETPLCAECELDCQLIECRGQCQRAFHADCLGFINHKSLDYKCEECLTGSHECFLCKQSNDRLTKKCAVSSCGKFYHDECAKSNEHFRKSNNGSYTCSLHACASCMSDIKLSPASITTSSSTETATKGRFVKCFRCPTAYHASDHCIAAGSFILNNTYIICPNHSNPIKNLSHHNRVNVTWCFVCCKTGELIGCTRCPAAYHADCLTGKNNSEINSPSKEDSEKSVTISNDATTSKQLSPSSVHSNQSGEEKSNKSNWLCEDCSQGKRPMYGQIVWAKVGAYRWWPAQICAPKGIPDNLRDYKCRVGEFLVKFFGTNDYFWVTIGRCFAFAEGDECHQGQSRTQRSLEISFKKSVEQAKTAFGEVTRIKQSRTSKTINKYNFQFIKTNRPYGNVTKNRLELSELPRCDCDPKATRPCASDEECLNRMLKYECHPAICLAGERCQNQRFVKRQYPKQEPIYTGSRGWGLKTLVDIKKGDFVNEYVGEIIDDEECKRRLEFAHENNICNFYFLTIDNNRVLDAGPKGNLARFMNHSCDPNCQTQKWNVAGDIRVGLFAVVDIPAGTELTFNYNLECLSNSKDECKCGAKNCSGFIGERPKNAQNGINNGSANVNEATGSKKRKLSDIAFALSKKQRLNEASQKAKK